MIEYCSYCGIDEATHYSVYKWRREASLSGPSCDGCASLLDGDWTKEEL
jgi:hypothetical protein